MEILSSRLLLAPVDLAASIRWYRDILGLRVYREYGTDGEVAGVVFFLGGGFLELTGPRAGALAGPGVAIWLQVTDLDAEHRRLGGLGVTALEAPREMPWGLREAWIADPDGTRLCLVEVPEDHPIRRRLS